MSDRAPLAPPPADQPDKPLGLWIAGSCLGLAIWLLFVGLVAIVGIYDLRANDLAIAKSLGFRPPTDKESLADVRIAFLTMFGASLGACLLSFLGLFQYAVLLGNFNRRYFGSYLVGPVAVMFLGLAVFFLARAGLFVFGNVGDTSQITPNNELSFLALGILVGFSWNHVLTRIAELGAQIFASTKQPISTSRAAAKPGQPAETEPASSPAPPSRPDPPLEGKRLEGRSTG